MSIPRFFVEDPTLGHGVATAAGLTVPLPASAGHHARRVLRLRPEEPIVLFDGNGNEYAAALLYDPRDAAGALARIHAVAAVDREARVAITLVQALSAQEKIDWLIEKCVELGVARVVLAPAERSVVRLDQGRGARRLERWRDIASAACAQCGRNRVPQILLAPDLVAALGAVPAGSRRWLLEPQAPRGLGAAAADGAGDMALVCAVGPEGGFTATEQAQAAALGYEAVRLGTRVLRTETAGLAAVAALLALHGEYR